MKKYTYFVIIAIASTTLVAGPIVTITDVQITPEQPSTIDFITIEVQGEITSGGITFDESMFIANQSLLQLDLYFTDKTGTVIPKSWSHDEEIGTLLQGDYDLLVQAYWRIAPEYEYILHDSCSTEFTVIPEPATILLFGIGGIGLKRNWG